MIRAGKLHVVHVDRRAHSSTCGERNVDRFQCVGLHAPLVEPGLDFVEATMEELLKTTFSVLSLPRPHNEE
jgi:hypothetical protein